MCSTICPKCASDMIEVIESRFLEVIHVRSAPCMCEESDTDRAWEHASVDTAEDVKISWLSEDGDLGLRERYEDIVDQDPQEPDVHCAKCWESYDESIVELQEESRKELPDMAKVVVRCNRCQEGIDHEIHGSGS